jgi:hypothetical protein
MAGVNLIVNAKRDLAATQGITPARIHMHKDSDRTFTIGPAQPVLGASTNGSRPTRNFQVRVRGCLIHHV